MVFSVVRWTLLNSVFPVIPCVISYLQDTKFSGVMYWICGVTTFISALLILRFPETKDLDLPDKISTEVDASRKSEDIPHDEADDDL